MARADLRSHWRKLARARERLDALRDAVRAYYERRPSRLALTDEPRLYDEDTDLPLELARPIKFLNFSLSPM